MDQDEKDAWKVVNYVYSFADIGFGLLARDPMAVVSLIGLIASFVDEIQQALYDGPDHTKKTIYLHRE